MREVVLGRKYNCPDRVFLSRTMLGRDEAAFLYSSVPLHVLNKSFLLTQKAQQHDVRGNQKKL